MVGSVIRAMIPSLTLRGVLETSHDLSLVQLFQFLEEHYNESSAEDLYICLMSLFISLSRGVLKWDKVLEASLKARGDSDISFNKNLVLKLFLRTLERCISSQYVAQEIRHLLRSIETIDEQLI